jgi:hypothetical protein
MSRGLPPAGQGRLQRQTLMAIDQVGRFLTRLGWLIRQ